jgi:hypothetical protein
MGLEKAHLRANGEGLVFILKSDVQIQRIAGSLAITVAVVSHESDERIRTRFFKELVYEDH